jgi:hypothetical protein
MPQRNVDKKNNTLNAATPGKITRSSDHIERKVTSNNAVYTRTGRTWQEWFAILDASGAINMKHKEIAQSLYQKHRVSTWWSQMITVTYEQERGLRDKHQKSDGYAISVSKVVSGPVDVLYNFWSDEKKRKQWLTEKQKASLTIRKSTPNKSMRIIWGDGTTHVEANFYAKGGSKSQITVQHSKLSNSEMAESMKAYWKKTLQRLANLLKKVQ